jgi:hypothetical protein
MMCSLSDTAQGMNVIQLQSLRYGTVKKACAHLQWWHPVHRTACGAVPQRYGNRPGHTEPQGLVLPANLVTPAHTAKH